MVDVIKPLTELKSRLGLHMYNFPFPPGVWTFILFKPMWFHTFNSS